MTALLLITTGISLILAVIASVVAWRAVAGERHRSDARVATLAQDIADAGTSGMPPLVAMHPLFAGAPEAERSKTPIAWAAGAIIVGTAVVFAILLSSGARPLATGARDAGPRTAQPLELIALTQERTADTVTIRGVVRNPTRGHDWTSLRVGVLLVDPEGRPLGRGADLVHDGKLRADDQASFVVQVPAIAEAGRYRVSFTANDQLVPHVDKREGE